MWKEINDRPKTIMIANRNGVTAGNTKRSESLVSINSN